LSKNTIIATIRAEQKRNKNQESLPCSSAPRIIDEVVRDKLVSKAYFEDTCITWTALTEYAKTESEQELHQRSVQRLFASMNMRKWKCLCRPALTELQAKARLIWAEDHKNLTEEQWKKVIWSDECSIECGKGVCQEWVFYSRQDRLCPENVQPRACSGGIRQMFWASFKHDIRTDLVIIEGDPESTQGGVTTKVYLSVLKEYLPTIFEPGDTFIQDSVSIHKARLV
jgi:hypothetical protein